MKSLTSLFLLTLLVNLSANLARAQVVQPTSEYSPSLHKTVPNVTQYVNPMIGVSNGPGEYPGAQMPFGLLAWNPVNTVKAWSVYTGGSINWFALSTVQGIGAGAMADVPHMVTVNPCTTAPGRSNVYNTPISDEVTAPGYYKVHLVKPKVDVEMAANVHTGIAKYTFPPSTDSCVIFDPLALTGPTGTLTIDRDKNMVTGSSDATDFGRSLHTTYYVAVFDRPFSSVGTWEKGQGFVKFDTTSNPTVRMKIALSYVSSENALNNLNTEIPGWDLQKVKSDADDAWNILLGSIQYTSGATLDRLQMFYTAMYRACQDPKIFSDTDGRYIGFDDQIHTVASGHKFYAGFSGWDVYRTQAQLMAIIAPEASADYCRSLVTFGNQNKGKMPKWAWLNKETNCMSGAPSCAYIGSAYAFGATDIDLPATKDTLVKFGTTPSLGWGSLAEHMAGGNMRSQAEEMEASNADMGLATICQATGDPAKYAYFRNRAQTIFNLWDPMRVDTLGGTGNFKGAGRETFIEEQIWCAPVNYEKLISLMGGVSNATARLDKHTSQMVPYNDQPYYNPSNEPGIHVPYVYNWLQVPWKTQRLIRQIMTESFVNSRLWIGGLPKLPKPPCTWCPNDDTGTMSAWYAYLTLGLYPAIPGVGGFTITSPLFSYTIHLKNGKDISVTAQNASITNLYIQSMTIDGIPNEKLWIPWDQLKNGASLVFVLGDKPNPQWGAAPDDAPPSFGPVKEASAP